MRRGSVELADVSLTTGHIVRLCDEVDDLRAKVQREAREAEALATAVMCGQWLRPVQPLHVEPLACR